MSPVDESLERLLSGATLAGFVSAAGEATPLNAAVLVERVEPSGNPHEWQVQAVVTPGGNGTPCRVNVDVKWAGSTPVLTIYEAEIPGVGTVSGKLMIHNFLFAGAWAHDGRKGQAWGEIVTAATQEPQPKRFVIERSSEFLREWWTGSDWSQDSSRARWFDDEPDGPHVTGDEESHPVCYPSGKMEAG